MVTKNVIETYNLSKKYDKKIIIDQINLQVPQGSIFGLLGPNGAGKTTLIKMLLGLSTPSSGEIKLFGESIQKNKIPLLGKIGAFIDTPSAFEHLNGVENLKYICKLRGISYKQIDKSLKSVGLKDVGKSKVKHYSLGMKQRLGIATALLDSPSLLVLDEPTNGLDPNGILEIRNLIQRLQNTGHTVFISSHQLSEIEKIATHIAIIESGNLRFQGTMNELMRNNSTIISIHSDDTGECIHLLKSMSYQVSINKHLIEVRGSESDIPIITNLMLSNRVSLKGINIRQQTLETSYFSKLKNIN
ncbi:ABC transporter ATP-binding protein [Bacillus sp. AFS015896]|uniref:ABC transporter ATP-binding protein n=1 Tax=Bacillus sp. AFS015896 TaxID=2033487 RepID=UPI000BF24DC5|nr:ABC transporter ATP-binding protein [Bacillus sp. AFS015896]PFA61914.1 bacitracin ABC transporter ATP-binding protein [Bacillus sp. AFS015896]